MTGGARCDAEHILLNLPCFLIFLFRKEKEKGNSYLRPDCNAVAVFGPYGSAGIFEVLGKLQRVNDSQCL